MKGTITFALMIKHFPRKKGSFRSIAFARMQYSNDKLFCIKDENYQRRRVLLKIDTKFAMFLKNSSNTYKNNTQQQQQKKKVWLPNLTSFSK